MAFPREVNSVPVKAGRIAVSFEMLSDQSTALDAGTVVFTLVDAAGNTVKTRAHGLLNEMSASQKNALINFIGQIRTKINGEAV